MFFLLFFERVELQGKVMVLHLIKISDIILTVLLDQLQTLPNYFFNANEITTMTSQICNFTQFFIELETGKYFLYFYELDIK